MANVKIILRNEQKADGLYPLAIRITKNRKQHYIYLDHRIELHYWDEKIQWIKKSCPNYVRLNNFLLKKLSEATDDALEVETKKPQASSKAIRQKIKPSVGVTFFPQADDYLEQLKKTHNYNVYTPDKSRIGHFKAFLKGDIAFSDISEGLLEKFEAWLKTTYVPKGKKKKCLSDRAIANHLVTIRSVFAHARKNKVIEKGMTPFGKEGKKIKFPETTKIPISIQDIHGLENLELKNPEHEHARKLWLFSYYFAGMRVSDVLRLKWTDFQEFRLHYKMGKNDKTGSLKIPAQAERILKYYEQFKENEDDLVFPELKGVDLSDEWETKRKITHKTSRIDKFLRNFVAPAAGITNKKLTMHITRHTFADLAGDTVPIQMLQKLYRHSHVSTTINYQQNFIHQAADDALDAVLKKGSQPKPT